MVAVRRIRVIVRFCILLLLVALALEVGLRAVGWATLWMRERQAGESWQPGTVRLLHLGESTTFGLGVAPAEAYPAVVGDILKKRYPTRRFVSVNRGVPGLVTTAMAQTLNGKLSQIKPTVVTIMQRHFGSVPRHDLGTELAMPTRSAHDIVNFERIDNQQNERGCLQDEKQHTEDQAEWSKVRRCEDKQIGRAHV